MALSPINRYLPVLTIAACFIGSVPEVFGQPAALDADSKRDGFLKVSPIAGDLTRIGPISDIQLIQDPRTHSSTIVVVGPGGHASFRPNDLTLERLTLFDRTPAVGNRGNFAVVDLNADGKPEFLQREEISFFVTALYGEDGQLLWRYLSDLPISFVRTANADNDKDQEVIVVCAEQAIAASITVLDPDGRVVRKQQWQPINDTENCISLVDLGTAGGPALIFGDRGMLVGRSVVDGKTLFTHDFGRAPVWVSMISPLVQGDGSAIRIWTMVYGKSAMQEDYIIELAKVEQKVEASVTPVDPGRVKRVMAQRFGVPVDWPSAGEKPFMRTEPRALPGESGERSLKLTLAEANGEVVDEVALPSKIRVPLRFRGGLAVVKQDASKEPVVVAGWGDSIWSVRPVVPEK